MTPLKAVAAIRLGAGAARRAPGAVSLLALAEVLALALGLAPLVVFLAALFGPRGLSAAMAPGTQVTLVVGTLLAAAGGWLLRTTAVAIAAQRMGDVVSEEHGAREGEGAGQWLATAALGLVLRVFALACGLGAVVAGMVFFDAEPGVASALTMTIATGLLVALPSLDAALDLGLIRAAVLGEGPGEALGRGLAMTWARRDTVIAVWAFYVLTELVATAMIVGVGGGVGAIPAPGAIWILLLGPRALVAVGGAVVSALFAAGRVGAYTLLVSESAGVWRVRRARIA